MRDLERGASTAEMPSFPRRCAQNGEIPAHFILEEGLCDVRGDVLAAWMEDLEMQRQRFKSSGHRGTLPGGAAKAGAAKAGAGSALAPDAMASPESFLGFLQSEEFQR